jgi:hypothetical protein
MKDIEKSTIGLTYVHYGSFHIKILILMHNIAIMHQEHNVAESIISTCLDITGKTKDNFKARRDITHVCNCPPLELDERGGKLRAPFCLKVKDRKEVMRWMKRLKFPDGYTIGLKQCLNVKAGEIHGSKSHDYPIIMEILLPIMLCGYLDNDIWKALAELSYFYRQLYVKEIKKRYDGEVGERDTGAYMQIRKNISSRVVQSNTISSCSYSI